MAGRHLGLIMTANTRSPKIQIIKAENMELKKISRGSAPSLPERQHRQAQVQGNEAQMGRQMPP